MKKGEGIKIYYTSVRHEKKRKIVIGIYNVFNSNGV